MKNLLQKFKKWRANKKIILITASTIVILAGLAFGNKAIAATYYSQGTLTSTNLLLGKTVSSIDSFWYNASDISTGTSLKVQFSQDNTNWYNSSGTLDGWNDCTTTGGATITFTFDPVWTGANFYYKMQFNSNSPTNDTTPVLDEIKVYYTSNTAPAASDVSIDSGATSITLNEGATKNVVCTATVTDNDGYEDITTVEAKLYRSGVGPEEADDNDNHYTLSGARDTYCSGSGNSGTCTFTFSVYSYAESTDAGSSYEDQNWNCQVTPSDEEGTGEVDTDDDGIEMDTLKSLDVTDINYGTVNPGSNSTGDHTATITNTGNVAIDFKVKGGTLSCAVRGTIPVNNQEYSLSSFTYGSGTDLQTTDQDVNADLSKPDSDNPTVTDLIYWQVGVSIGTEGTCTGTTYFTARLAM